MYSNFMNKSTFMTNTPSTGFGAASTSTFGQPSTNPTMFSSMQSPGLFQTPSTSSFNAGPSTQNTFGSGLFGQQQQPSTSGLFSSSNAFGQSKPAFGFGSPTPQPSLFGQQSQPQPGSTLFQPNSTNLFGSSTFGNQPTSGTVIKFAPVTGSDTMQKNGVTSSISTKHHCITCMKEYENKSLEELRFEDYSSNRKGPQQQTGFAATPFGGTATAAPSLFGQTDNKQAFGQTTGFGQTSTFGQGTPAFGVTNQTSTPSLFGKPTFGTSTSNTSTFGFTPTPATANPFSASQPAKAFSQPLFGTTTQAQSTFGTNMFGQNATQNTAGSLFQKPAQPTTGFNTGQTGFSFNQPPTSQASNLFQVSKPSAGFGVFGQTNTGTTTFGQTTSQPAFGTNFGNKLTTSFAQPTQPAFGSTMGGGLLFGNTANKPPTLFGNTTSTGMFGANTFPQPAVPFSLNTTQQQPVAFPPETDDSKNMTLLATDIFPHSSHLSGLDPKFDPVRSTTNPQDLKAVLDNSKKRDEYVGSGTKLKVQIAPMKRGNKYNKEFFEMEQSLKSSPKFLVIRKFNESKSTIFNKYKNEVLEEANQCVQTNGTVTPSTPRSPEITEVASGESSESNKDSGKKLPIKKHTGTSSDETSFETLHLNVDGSSFSSKILNSLESKQNNSSTSSSISPDLSGEVETESPPDVSVTEPAATGENTSGVVLSKPEYYMYPDLKDLHQYMDENGDCIVQGLTIGRKGYGNIYFPDPINIANMNLDDIVHFRHREVIVYPDDVSKPPLGQGLNRRAQVTLDKVYPREKGTNNYITDVDEIVQSNFVQNLMHVTQKHDCKFIDYRPKTGSWVFKVKHFSKYGITESDEEDCEVAKAAAAKKAKDILKQYGDMEEAHPPGLGGISNVQSLQLAKEIESFERSLLNSPIEILDDDVEVTYHLAKEIQQTESRIQNLKYSLFTNLEMAPHALARPKPAKARFSFVEQPLEMLSEVECEPKIYQVRDISGVAPSIKLSSSQRCYIDLSLMGDCTFRVGWSKGFTLFNREIYTSPEVIYAIQQVTSSPQTPHIAAPNIDEVLPVLLAESAFTFDSDKIPTLCIKRNAYGYLEKLSNIFNKHTERMQVTGMKKYLCCVWDLCSALWGNGDNSTFARRQKLSSWLKKFTNELSYDCSVDDKADTEMTSAFKRIFKLLSFYKVAEASEFAMKANLNRLSLLISQLSGNETFKGYMRKHIAAGPWDEKSILNEDVKRIYLILAGVAKQDTVNICENVDWLRCLGLYLWYLAPAASSIECAFKLYTQSFTESPKCAPKPTPLYCTEESDSEYYDLLYHILALYVDSTHQLSKALHPETHTGDLLDYRLSWLLLQLFLSLNVGRITDAEKIHLHTSFVTQLEEEGLWQWSVFALLYLENNTIKKNLIMGVLERNISPEGKTVKIEDDLVNVFKIPPRWIHEVKASMAKMTTRKYDCFQHYVAMEAWHDANKILVDDIAPDLFLSEQYGDMFSFMKRLEPGLPLLANWETEAGLLKEFIELQQHLRTTKEIPGRSVALRLNFLLRKVNRYPIKNDRQKLCVAELSRRCILAFKLIYLHLEKQVIEDGNFITIIKGLAMPDDIRSVELKGVAAK